MQSLWRIFTLLGESNALIAALAPVPRCKARLLNTEALLPHGNHHKLSNLFTAFRKWWI